MTTHMLPALQLPKRFDSVIIQNKIKDILKNKGFENALPSPTLLRNIGGISRNKFTRMLNNKTQPTFEETYLIAAWLNVDLSELYEFKITTNLNKKTAAA